jgi:hypothetical protein
MSPEEDAGEAGRSVPVVTSASCVDAFDALWFCYSPGHQVRRSRSNDRLLYRAAPVFSVFASGCH